MPFREWFLDAAAVPCGWVWVRAIQGSERTLPTDEKPGLSLRDERRSLARSFQRSLKLQRRGWIPDLHGRSIERNKATSSMHIEARRESDPGVAVQGDSSGEYPSV